MALPQLQVTDVTVHVILKKLLTREWLVPQFQRDFVWSNAAVIALVNSIIDSRPVGMITLWEQQENTPLQLEPVSVPDLVTEENLTGRREYVGTNANPGRYYAVLDGRQRSTALALVFGGLRAKSSKYRNSGAFFLDVTARDDGERVKYFTQKEISRKLLGTLSGAIGQGLFPLAVEDPDKMMGQWMEYLQLIYNTTFYADGKFPEPDELKRRNSILSSAFAGIFNTKLAVYIVPQEYTLPEICEIFSTLNTTGTKVSTVDLIHSNLFNDTVGDAGGPLLLRDRIDALGELDGAVGWASAKERPELIAQLVAAAYVAADTKAAPRATGGKETKITSVKSGDLLALPPSFWRKVFDESATFANFLGGFQKTVAGGNFGMADCPYPASAAIYVGLRWFLEFDGTTVHWGLDKLDRLYRAFFWRNALASRYDQGFLTQIGTDIQGMKKFLNETGPDEAEDFWRTRASAWLDAIFGPRPPMEDIKSILSDGEERGASRRAALLLLHARAKQDVITPELSISLESGMMDLHHIYPKDWCKNNSAALNHLIGSEGTGGDWVNSAANLIPMHRRTNNEWRKNSPSTFLTEKDIDYDGRQDIWNWYFIDRESFDDLLKGEQGVKGFWKRRASLIAEEIYSKTGV